MDKNSKISIIYLVGTSVFYGLLIVVQKLGLRSGLEPLTFSFIRSIIIVPISLVIFSKLIKEIKFLKKKDLRNLLILGFVSAVAIIILFIGQHNTTATNAGFLIRLTPLFVLPFGFFILDERASKTSIIFLLVILVGTFLLTTEGAIISPVFGDVLIIFVACIVAFQNVFAKKIMQRLDINVIIFFRVFISSLVIIIIVPFIIVGNISINIVNISDNIIYVLLAAILYFLSVVCHYTAIKFVGPFITSSFFLMGALLSAIFAYLLIGERLSFIQWAGAGAILIGGFFLIKYMNRSHSFHH